jgi:carbon storage regulator
VGLGLTRRPGQSVNIGDDITVTVVRVDGDAVVLRVQAPKEILILRSELPKFPVPPADTPLRQESKTE